MLVDRIINHFRKTYFCYIAGIDDLAFAALAGVAVSAISTGVQNFVNNYNQNKANSTNLNVANKQFEEQKLLNRNGFQMQVADMQAAGLNPATLNGNNLSAGSYSSNQVAPQVDLSPLSDLASSYMQMKAQKNIADAQIESAEKINAANNASAEKMKEMELKQQSTEFNIIQDKEERRLKLEEARSDLENANLKVSQKKILEDIIYTRAQSDSEIRKLWERVKFGLPEAALTSNVGAAAAVAKALVMAAQRDDYEAFSAEYRKLLLANSED